MANINVNISEVRKQARELKDASSKLLSGTVKTIEDCNGNMASVWSGESSRSFMKYTDELISALKSNADDLSKISVFLNNACASLEKADREAKAKI